MIKPKGTPMAELIRFKVFKVLYFSKSGEQEAVGKFTYNKTFESREDFPTIARNWLKRSRAKDGWPKDMLCMVFQAADRGFYLCEDDLK